MLGLIIYLIIHISYLFVGNTSFDFVKTRQQSLFILFILVSPTR